MIDYNAGQFWFTVIQLIITISGWFYAWWTSRTKVTNARFIKLEERMGTLETTTANPVCTNHIRMEANDERLFKRLDTLHGDIKEISGSVRALSHSLNLINEHLINRGK